MDTDEHPVAKLTRETAEAAGMNWSAEPPSDPGGQWTFAIWPKGQDRPSSDD